MVIVKTFKEAVSIKNAINKLNKRLGKKKRGNITRTRDMKFEVRER